MKLTCNSKCQIKAPPTAALLKLQEAAGLQMVMILWPKTVRSRRCFLRLWFRIWMKLVEPKWTKVWSMVLKKPRKHSNIHHRKSKKSFQIKFRLKNDQILTWIRKFRNLKVNKKTINNKVKKLNMKNKFSKIKRPKVLNK